MVVKVRDLRPCDRTIDPSSSSWGRQNQFIGGTKKSGLWMVTVQFVFGSLLVAELRSEQKVKTHVEGQQDQRPPHTQQRDGKRQWELMWRNGLNKQSLRSPAPYYPIIYTAWELGKAGCLRPLLPSTEKWHATPRANQKAGHYRLRQVLNSFGPNVFILNIPGKLWPQRQAMSPATAAALMCPEAKHTPNYITTLEIVFVQSIV